MKNFKEILIPNILKGYRCQSCGECCENKWNINFDNSCYENTKKYLEEKGEKLEEYLIKKEGEEALVKFDENLKCKLMDKDGLCLVQKELGWEKLSNTCKDYPRYKYLTKRGLEVGFSFSCKTSTINLLDKRKFIIEKVKREDMFMMLPTNIIGIIPEYEISDFRRSYFEREEKLIEIFNNREESLKESFIKALPLILEDGKKILGGEKEEEKGIANLINRYLSLKENNGNTMKEYLYLLRSYEHKKIFEKNWSVNSIILDEDIIKESKKSWEIKDDYILRHYICNYIFSKKFFLKTSINLLQLLVTLTIFKVYKVFYENQFNEKLNQNQIIRMITNVESNYGHAGNIKDKNYKNLEEGGIVDLAINTFINQL